MDFYGFYTGKIFDAYDYLGAHINNGTTIFRTFAPAASRITVFGDFNHWQEWDMHKVSDGNFWELSVPGTKEGMMYKYCIYDRSGNRVEHCDPYGFGMELRPGSASVIRNQQGYSFHDEEWMAARTDCRQKPLNIYELHFGSFKKPSDKADSWYTYEEMAKILIPYVKNNGYNYLEIMPLNEYPCDESWGYQATGFFSPTSRYGTADQLKYFVDCCHQNGIGVIMDFVPVHFALDSYGLAQYDGTALYEYPHSAVGVSEWGSCNFMHSRGEVRSFLQSSANYWIKEFHIDEIADQNGRKDDDGNQVGNHKQYRIIRGKTFLRSFVFRSGMAPLVGLVTGAGAATPLQHVEQRVEHRTARQRTRSPAPLPGATPRRAAARRPPAREKRDPSP